MEKLRKLFVSKKTKSLENFQAEDIQAELNKVLAEMWALRIEEMKSAFQLPQEQFSCFVKDFIIAEMNARDKLQNLAMENLNLKKEIICLRESESLAEEDSTNKSQDLAGQFEGMQEKLEQPPEELGTNVTDRNLPIDPPPSYSSLTELINKDGKILMALEKQSTLIRQLQVEKSEAENREKELRHELQKFQEDNERQQKLLSQNLPVDPEPCLNSSNEIPVTVKVKDGTQYKGSLVGAGQYINIKLEDVQRKNNEKVGEIFLTGRNLSIHLIEEVEEDNKIYFILKYIWMVLFALVAAKYFSSLYLENFP